MVLWCNGLAHVPSKHIVGVRIPLGLQMESKPIGAWEQFAKLFGR